MEQSIIKNWTERYCESAKGIWGNDMKKVHSQTPSLQDVLNFTNVHATNMGFISRIIGKTFHE